MSQKNIFNNPFALLYSILMYLKNRKIEKVILIELDILDKTVEIYLNKKEKLIIDLGNEKIYKRKIEDIFLTEPKIIYIDKLLNELNIFKDVYYYLKLNNLLNNERLFSITTNKRGEICIIIGIHRICRKGKNVEVLNLLQSTVKVYYNNKNKRRKKNRKERNRKFIY